MNETKGTGTANMKRRMVPFMLFKRIYAHKSTNLEVDRGAYSGATLPTT